MQQLARQRQVVSPIAVGQKAVVPDPVEAARQDMQRKRAPNPSCAVDDGVAERSLYAVAAAGVAVGGAVPAAPADRHLCGSSGSRSRCLSVGRRSKTSFRYAHGSCPFSLADSIRLMTTAARSPACCEPTNSQFLRLC